MRDMVDSRDDIPTPHRIVNLAMCTAVSIDTCTAVARFLNRLFGGIPAHRLHTPGFLRNLYPLKPVPLGTGTGFLGYGYG